MYEVFLASVAVVLVIYIIRSRSSQKHVNLPPGPEPTFLAGNFKDLDTSNVHQSLHRLAQQYGPVVYIRLLSKNIVILNTSEVIQKAYATDAYRLHLNDKAKGFYGTYVVYNHSDVLLGPYNNITFRLKDIMLKGFKPSLSSTTIRQETEKLVQRLKRHGGEDVCVSDEIKRSMAEVLTMLLLGEATAKDVELMWDFVNWSNKLLYPSVESLLKNAPFLRFLPVGPGFLYAQVIKKRDVLLKRYLDEYRISYKPGIHRGLVDTCLLIQAEELALGGQPWLTDDMIKALILDTIGAGLVATTSCVQAALLNLVHNPACVTRMQTEIKSVLGKDRYASPDDMGHLHYCSAVVLETLRLSSVVPIVSHFCSTDDVEFEGYNIPKGTMVWGNIWSAHHDEDSWQEPWIFRPERFLDGQGRLIPEDSPLRSKIIALGVGPRYCVGKNFAMTRLFSYVTTIVQHCAILPPKDKKLLPCDPNKYNSGVVLEIQDLYLRLESSA